MIAGFVLYLRERRRCDALACRMAGSPYHACIADPGEPRRRHGHRARPVPRIHLRPAGARHERRPAPRRPQHGRDPMSRRASVLVLLLGLLVGADPALASASTAVLAVDGMT